MNALMSRFTGGATQRQVNKTLGLAMALALMVTGGYAAAFTAPSSGTLGYDVYNVVVNQLLSGPIGFVGAVILIVWGASQVMKQWLITVLCVIAGTVIIKCQSIVTTLGAVVPSHQAVSSTGAVMGMALIAAGVAVALRTLGRRNFVITNRAIAAPAL